MIDRQEMTELLLTACPSFTTRWNEGLRTNGWMSMAMCFTISYWVP